MEAKKISLEEIIKMGTDIGIKAGMDFIAAEKAARRSQRHDRRLRNTRLLLREYKNLLCHCQEAKFQTKSISGNAINILDQLDEEQNDDELYIESIKKSAERTKIIIAHIKNILAVYRHICQKTGDERNYSIIHYMYLSKNTYPVEKIAELLLTDRRTVYRDLEKAVAQLTTLMFGIDGLKV